MLNPIHFLVFTLLSHMVEGATSGAKSTACAEMIPLHGGAVALSTAPPFSFQISPSTYGCNTSLSVTLSSSESAYFKGFLCQVRTDPYVYQTFGTLRSTGNVSTTNNCDKQASLTHADSGIKTSATFNWTHPGYNVGPVFIVCTIVQDFSRFWTFVISEPIKHSDTCSDHVTHLTTTENTTSSGGSSTNGTSSTVSTKSHITTEVTIHTDITPNTNRSSTVISTMPQTTSDANATRTPLTSFPPSTESDTSGADAPYVLTFHKNLSCLTLAILLLIKC